MGGRLEPAICEVGTPAVAMRHLQAHPALWGIYEPASLPAARRIRV